MKAFLKELRRRKVFRVAIVYLIAGWLVMQVVDVMFPALSLPEWSVTLVAALLIVGFPMALVLSWAFAFSPEGIRREGREETPDLPEQKAPARTADIPKPPAKASVAVLPFIDMSPEKDQEYFSDGMTEELLNALTQMRELQVASRTSSFAFKGTAADIPSIASKLGVDFVVEGSVRKAAERLRVTAQLIEVVTDKHLWSQSYDRDLDDVFAIQDDIARQIAGALKITLLPRQVQVPSTDNVEAYEYFLRGRSYLHRMGQKNMRMAIEMFERATEIDPGFARAWAGQALAHAYLYILSFGDSEDIRAAESASAKAIEIAPDVADGYTARIMVAAASLRFDEVEEAFSKAVELNHRDFDAHYMYARVKWKQGDMRAAVEHFESAREIDPADFQSPILSISIYRSLGEEEKALEAARQGQKAVEAHLEQHPDNPRAYILGAAALLFLGQNERGIQYVESALRLDPESEDTQYNAACFFANAGEHERALDCLELGMHDPDWLENDSDLDSIRDLPRFQALLNLRRELHAKKIKPGS